MIHGQLLSLSQPQTLMALTYMSIEIQPASSADVAKIAHFQICMADETEGKQLDPQIVDSGVTQVLNDASKGFYLVAKCEDETVGSLLVTYEWSDWRNLSMWYIQSVYVLPEYRGRKIFSKMFEQVKQMATQQGALYVRLYVETDNVHAQNVYQKLGMSRMPYYMYDIKL